MRISFSAYDTYNRCPAQYKFNYVDRITVPKKIELEFGSLMHAVVDLALKKDPIVPPVEELYRFFDDNFSKITFKDDRQKSQYQNVGREMIKVFHDSLTPGLRSTIATEKRFQLDLNDKHILSGVIDRIDKLPFGAFEVIDYKTNFKPKTQAEVDRDKQLGIYKMAVEYFWPEADDIRLSLFFLRTNQKITTSRVKSEIEELKQEIIETCEKIETDNEFKPKKNPLCDWCDYQNFCPLYNKDGSNIERTINEYLRTQERILQLEQEIHDHFDRVKIERLATKDGELIRENDKIKYKKHRS